MRFNSTCWQMIDAAARGEREAMEALVDRYRPPIKSYLQRCGWSEADADDLAQEVVVRLWERVVPQADAERGRFRGLLLTVTRNVAREHWRRGQAQKRGGDQAHVPLEEARDVELPSESVFDREWLAYLLTRALGRLQREHSSYHAALSATLLEGLSYSEAAAKLGVNETKVRNGVHRGRQKVMGYLAEQVDEYAGGRAEHETEMGLLRGLMQPGEGP